VLDAHGWGACADAIAIAAVGQRLDSQCDLAAGALESALQLASSGATSHLNPIFFS
jgi:hypothetical protein